MNHISQLIPKNKFDTSSIKILDCIESIEAQQILDGLMEWIKDLNWPVAQELIRIMPRFHVQLVPVIQNIFKTNDDVWKLSTLEWLRSFPHQTILMLQSELEKMAYSPA